MHKFHRLYSIAINYGNTLTHAGKWNNSRWEWEIGAGETCLCEDKIRLLN